MPRTRQQRLTDLAEFVLDAGAISIHDVAARFDVALMTAYRDVADLEAAGVLYRRRGMAIARASSFTETTNTFRSTLNMEVKKRLCRAATSLLRPGSTIMLDDSSTLLPLVDMLPDLAPLTVITNSQSIAASVAKHPQLRLFVTGGSYRGSLESYYGEVTVATLKAVSADVCLMSATAIHNGTIFHPFEENVAVKRAMMEASNERVLLVDASKFRQRATHRVCSVADFDHVIVARGISADEHATLTTTARSLTIVGEDSTQPRL